jgi:hypothetical protein
MGGVFYLAGVILAGFAGYSGLEWLFIFISSLIMAVGYFIIRAPQITGIVSSDGDKGKGIKGTPWTQESSATFVSPPSNSLSIICWGDLNP